MQKNLVSIVMPAFNSEDYLDISIKSVINQTYKNWELLIVNDSSQDDTPNILNKYVDIDSRIKIFNNKKRLGAAKSRDFAFNVAKGRFIAFLDSDDFWIPAKLEKQLKFMNDNNYQFTYAYYNELNTDGSSYLLKAPAKINFLSMMFICPIGCLSVIYDTEKIGKIMSEDIKKRNDYALWIKIIRKTKNAHCFKESLGTYRKGNMGLSANKLDNLRYYWAIMMMFYSKFLIIMPISTIIYLTILVLKKSSPNLYNKLF